MYDLLVKGGTVLDRAQGISGKMDVAIAGGRVEAVEDTISDGKAKKTIDARGLIVSPGLIDIHTHVAWELVRLSIDPFVRCLLKGTTTAVDAGSTGELNYRGFEHYVIEASKTRILAFINIESLGMVEFADIKPGNTDQEWPSLLTRSKEKYAGMFISEENTERLIRDNPDKIVGIKWAHHGIKGMEKAREVGDSAGCRLMVENKFMPAAGVRLLKKGDIITHIFHDSFNANSGYVDGMCQDGTIPEEFFQMKKRGIIFDVGHGQGSFSWDVGELAFKEGLRPDTISSDLWSGNVKGPVYDLPTVMSKFLHLGMSLEDVFAAATSEAASAVGRRGKLGSLQPGRPADLAAFKIREGNFPMEDCYGEVRKMKRHIVPVHVVKGGELVLSNGKPVSS
ncbi:MAG: amidohydrolase family protein [Nitrososphaerota archaeon]|nr:amidohydrolase family protein [Nitrososphaerota archaeon]